MNRRTVLAALAGVLGSTLTADAKKTMKHTLTIHNESSRTLLVIANPPAALLRENLISPTDLTDDGGWILHPGEQAHAEFGDGAPFNLYGWIAGDLNFGIKSTQGTTANLSLADSTAHVTINGAGHVSFNVTTP